MNAKSKRFLRCSAKAIMLAATFAMATSAAAATYDMSFVTGPAFLGRDTGFDGYWGTGDDNTSGSSNPGYASFAYSVNSSSPYLDYYQGAFQLSTTSVSNVLQWASASTVDQFGNTTVLDGAHISTVTYTDAQHYSSDLYSLTNGNPQHAIGVNGYTLYNVQGYNDPGVFGDAGLAASFNYVIAALPSNWTAVSIEYLSYEGIPYPETGNIAVSFSTDSGLLPAPVPVPPAVWLMISALAAIGVRARPAGDIHKSGTGV